MDHGDGKVTSFPFKSGEYSSLVRGGGDLAPAYEIKTFSFTINNIESDASVNYNPHEIYNPITGSVQPPQGIEFNQNFNSDFINVSPSSQIWTSFTDDYVPIPKVGVLKSTSDTDLQTYYQSPAERYLSSAPTRVKLNFSVTAQEIINGIELIGGSEPFHNTYNHLFYVISWDDKENKFSNWDNVLQDMPEDEIKILNKQKENLYIFAKAYENGNDFHEYKPTPTYLINNYKTPGIKTIKSVMFSYKDNASSLEPIRWKFITTRIFLDIPVSSWPDFSEFGGADYVTLPWQHTAPIIGGLDKN